jgi:ATP-dependent RNA helicase RhlE
MITFDQLNLNKPLLNALEEMEYFYPTPIQEQAFSVIMSGKNVTGLAQTGTGKTLAYLLPLLRQIKYSEQKQPRILIMVPTRELVLQVLGEIKRLTKYMEVRAAGAYGGSNMNNQKEAVFMGLDVLVATPGRLLDLQLSGVLKLKSIQHLVIDEVDEMLSLGFRSQLTTLMNLMPDRRQNLLFSATLSPDVEKLIGEYILNPYKIEVDRQGTPVERIKQQGYYLPNFYSKVNMLCWLLEKDEAMRKVLVFAKNKRVADELYANLTGKFPGQVGVIHSNKSQPQRFKAIDRFDTGTNRVLIATDIIARGLDLAGVSHVINFDLPDTPGDYVHRIGRTGRAEAEGAALSFVSPQEEEYLEAIEAYIRRQIPMQNPPLEVKISDLLTEDEKPVIRGKNPLKGSALKDSGGAFHEKKDKNKKVNLGGPGVRYAKVGSVRSAKKKRKY